MAEIVPKPPNETINPRSTVVSPESVCAICVGEKRVWLLRKE